jgi:GNAT superfamily N-acetyltransferase
MRFKVIRFSPNMPGTSKRWLKEVPTRGVPIPPLGSDRVILSTGQREILVVTPDAAQWQVTRAHRVGAVANEETRFDCVYPARLPENTTHAFIVRDANRAIGIAVLKSRLCSGCTWQGSVRGEEKRLWTVTFVWVLESQRRRGIAKTLVGAVAEYFGVGLDEIGWLLPFTASGEHLAKGCCPKALWADGDLTSLAKRSGR